MSGTGALTVAQAAELTGLHIQTIRKRIRNGELAAAKVPGPRGPEWRIERIDVLALIGDEDGEAAQHPESDSPSDSPLRLEKEVAALKAALDEHDALIDQIRRDLQQVREEVATATVSVSPDPIPDAAKAEAGLTARCVALLAPMAGGRSSAAVEQAVMNATQVHPLARDVLLEVCAALVARWNEEGDRVKLSFLPGNVARAARWLERDQAREKGATRRLPPSTTAEDATGPLTVLKTELGNLWAACKGLPWAEVRERWLQDVAAAIKSPGDTWLTSDKQAANLLVEYAPKGDEKYLPSKWLSRVEEIVDPKQRNAGQGMMPVSNWEAKRRSGLPKSGVKGTGWHLLDQILEEDE
jgi:excisionase family DNA binding protein